MKERYGGFQQGSADLHILISAKQIEARVAEIAECIRRDYRGQELTIIAVMSGAIFFLVDLLRLLDMPVRLEVTHVSSYTGTESSGSIKVLSEITIDMCNRHVLVVDDILDSGLTLDFVLRLIAKHSPASVRSCVLVRKQVKRARHVEVDYHGFDIDGEFVVGYGLDYNNFYRNLPYIAQLKLPSDGNA